MAELIEQVGWIDLSTLVILTVFFILGLFRGLIWQLSRFLTIILGYVLAGLFAKDLEGFLVDTWPESAGFALLAAWFAIFIAVFIALSALAWLLTGLLKKLKMGAYDRLGGGLVGTVTGAAIVVFLLVVVFAVFGAGTGIVQAAEKSRTKRFAVSTLTFLEQDLNLTLVTPVLNVIAQRSPVKEQPPDGSPPAEEQGEGEPR